MASLETKLLQSFPQALSERIGSLVKRAPPVLVGLSPSGTRVFILNGEELVVPYRIYSPEPPAKVFEGFGTIEKSVLSCLYTRHHDGRIRQKHLERLIHDENYWVAPFVFLLLSEYVLELIQIIEKNKAILETATYRDFFSENPDLVATSRQRMTSYWNCYYRREWPRETYPGFILFDLIDRVSQ